MGLLVATCQFSIGKRLSHPWTTGLQTLIMVDNNINSLGARALCSALDRNDTLTDLDLRGNHFGAEGYQHPLPYP